MPLPLAFIPWFTFPSLELGPVTIQSFGVLSALGILAAVEIGSRADRQLGNDPRVIPDYAVAGVISGVVFGHLVHLFAYHPEELAEPWRILKFWEGLSSMGGLLGGILAAIVFFRLRRIPLRDHTDAFALGIAPGWGVARLGCFTVHDHPGVLTTFPLAVRFPGGPGFPAGPRHDLGLYEAIVLFAIGGLLWALHRRNVLRGRLLAVLALLYGIARFLLDFLRATDVPYADGRIRGLTFAQYFAVLLVAWSVWAMVRYRPPAFAAAAPR